VTIGPLAVGTGAVVLTGLEVYSSVAGATSVESAEMYDLIASLDQSVMVDRVVYQTAGPVDSAS
jgi:hypothetical protein